MIAVILAVAVLVMFEPRPWIDPTLPLAGLFLLACIVRPGELRFSFPMIPLAGAVAWGLLRGGDKLAMIVWVGNLAAFWLALQARRRFTDLLLYFAFALSVISVVQYFSGSGDARSWGPLVNRDQYAAFIELVLPLALVPALGGAPHAFRFAVMAAAMYATVISGASRAGAVLTTAEIAIVQLAMWRKGRRSGAARLLPLAVVFVAVAGWAVLWNRFSDPDPLGGRREILAGTVAMIEARPWTGFGLGTFRTVYPAYAPVDFGSVVHHAHNDWAEWAADGGIPFSLMLLAIAVWSVPRAFRTLWGIGIVAVFVHSLVDFPLQKPALELWLFAMLGALAAENGATADRG
jgi:O-antigen ligase